MKLNGNGAVPAQGTFTGDVPDNLESACSSSADKQLHLNQPREYNKNIGSKHNALTDATGTGGVP